MKDFFDNEFPFNRKERFFTGTIFPGIVCRDNFRYLHVLLQELAPNKNIEVQWSSKRKNILFFTEYNLKESLMGLTSDECFMNLKGDTPDILFVIFGDDENYLFALEAKMFDIPGESKLLQQMEDQKVILEKLGKLARVESCNIFHAALLPEGLSKTYISNKFDYITWDRIAQLYASICAGDYNLNVLEYALKEYKKFVAKKSGTNAKGSLRGIDILNRYKELGIKCVGRGGGGLNGDAFSQDIIDGTWGNQVYQWTDEQIPPNRN